MSSPAVYKCGKIQKEKKPHSQKHIGTSARTKRSVLLVFWHRQRLVHNIVFHLYFGQNRPTLQRVLCVIAQLLVELIVLHLIGIKIGYIHRVNIKKIVPPVRLFDISAMRADFCVKFYLPVKQSHIHFITKFGWNILENNKIMLFQPRQPPSAPDFLA